MMHTDYQVLEVAPEYLQLAITRWAPSLMRKCAML